MITLNTTVAQQFLGTVVSTDTAIKGLLLDVIGTLNGVAVNNKLKIEDLHSVIRHCIHDKSFAMNKNDLGPLGSLTLIIDNCTVEFASIFGKCFRINVRVNNRGPKWVITAKNWDHLTEALKQKSPKFLG